MISLHFFPLGNADCCRIDLSNGRKVLFDYANTHKPDDPTCRAIDLAKALRDDLSRARQNHYDVVAFTHLDRDHYHRATEFFWLEHATTYQSDERVRIRELWVPAGLILEEGCDAEARVIRQEARYRLKRGERIRVFGRPAALASWLTDQGIPPAERAHLFTDAGKVVPGFTLDADGVEFFAHSPFAWRLNQDGVEDRNLCSLVAHATFFAEGRETRFLLGGDAPWEALRDIVRSTELHRNEQRLQWDVAKLPHHCSYLSLGPEKGVRKTQPDPDVARLYEEYGQTRSVIVSTSNPIPTKDEDQPPHRQAANYYTEDVTTPKLGKFKVTMEHPRTVAPEEMIIWIGSNGAMVEERVTSGPGAAVSTHAPRAG